MIKGKEELWKKYRLEAYRVPDVCHPGGCGNRDDRRHGVSSSFLGEIGVTDAGEAAFWAGLISGVTPFMIALSAPFWSIQADRRGPKLVMSIVLAAVTLTAFLCAVSTSPWQVFIFRLLQGLVGGFVPIGLSVIASVSPEEETSRTLGYFQAAMVSGIMFGPLVGGLVADTLGYRMPFVFFGVLSLICLICLRLFMPEIHRKGASGENLPPGRN